MYLSKKDYDFLVYMHDNILLDTLENRKENIPSLYHEMDLPVRIACYFSNDEYEYFVTMLTRLKIESEKQNEKQKIVMREKRKLHGKNYGRGYVVSLKKKDID